ncbi:reverse transcriptase, partial [Phytophthora megakarya]
MKSAEGHLATSHSGFVVTQDEESCPGNPGCPSALDVMTAPLPRAAKILVAVTRASVQDQQVALEPLDPLSYQRERWRRIKVHQEQDEYLCDLRDFLNGEVDRFTLHQLRKIAKVADLFALDARGVLYRLAQSTRGRPRDAQDELRLVTSYAHEDFQGGHQGIKRTHEKLRSVFYWPGMYADVERHVKECVDCASGKGHPSNPGPFPGNIEQRRPFEVVSMDSVTHMPKSERGNTFLLLFQDMFSGFVMELLGSRQRSTLSYRPQANGQQERSVQTVIRSVRAYAAEADQSDWDDHAERL